MISVAEVRQVLYWLNGRYLIVRLLTFSVAQDAAINNNILLICKLLIIYVFLPLTGGHFATMETVTGVPYTIIIVQ